MSDPNAPPLLAIMVVLLAMAAFFWFCHWFGKYHAHRDMEFASATEFQRYQIESVHWLRIGDPVPGQDAPCDHETTIITVTGYVQPVASGDWMTHHAPETVE